MEAHDENRGAIGSTQAAAAIPLSDVVERIRTREDLALFVRALLDDLGDDPAGWENPNLERFLSALASYLEDLDGYFLNLDEPVPAVPSWRLIGELLLAAKMYE